MSKKDMEQMKKLLADKKAESKYLAEEKKVGSGYIEIMNKSKGKGQTRTKKIAQ